VLTNFAHVIFFFHAGFNYGNWLRIEESTMLKNGVGSARGWRHSRSCLWLFAAGLLLESLALPVVASGQTIQEVRVQWTTSPPLPPGTSAERRNQTVSHLFSILDQQKMSGRLPRQREPELSSDKVVIVARAAGGKIIDWQVVADPRIIRAEAPVPGGELDGRVLYRDRADFLFTLPDDPDIERIDFYQPRWTGRQFDLDLIGGVPLR
jgi:hypothetical protein